MVDNVTRNLLGLTTGLQAASLVGENLSFFGKKKKKGGLLRLGMTNLIGTGLIGAQSKMISEL